MITPPLAAQESDHSSFTPSLFVAEQTTRFLHAVRDVWFPPFLLRFCIGLFLFFEGGGGVVGKWQVACGVTPRPASTHWPLSRHSLAISFSPRRNSLIYSLSHLREISAGQNLQVESGK
jgi:hypothetical protein